MPFYKDIALSFDKDPFSKDILTKVDVSAVKQALKVLVLTNPGEKPFDPNFGAGVSGLLFENLNMGTKILMEDRIKEQVSFYEPRVKLEKVTFDEDNIDSNEITITIQFYVVGTNVLQNLDISFERIK